VNSANLFINITDNDRDGLFGTGFLGELEYANLFVDGIQKWNSFEVDGQIYSLNVFAQAIDNNLSVKIDWAGGDFGVCSVKVQGEYTASVPEPATMLMLGLGLVGLAGFGRKKFNS